MRSISPLQPQPLRLVALLTLVTGSERAAQEIAFTLDGEDGTTASLDACSPETLAGALQLAVRRDGAAGSLSATARLVLVLARASKLSEEQAAEAAGMTVETFRGELHAAEEALAAGPNRRAVILEDHLLARESLAEQARAADLEVVVATGDGAAAVAAAAAFTPAIAFVDITLDGAELAGELGAMQIRDVAPDCHVMFVTGYPDAARIAQLMQNASALIKPVGQEQLSAAVGEILPSRPAP